MDHPNAVRSRRRLAPSSVLPVGLLALASAVPAAAQAQFVETFDDLGSVSAGQGGPAGLVQKGWIFRNQSDPQGNSTWTSGTLFSPQAGADYLSVDSLVTDFFGGSVSAWAILPAVPNQVAGDTLTVHLRRSSSSNDDTIQVRYSPNGSAATGSSATDVGDFTQLLLDVDPPSSSGWSAYTVTLPGPGRVALRYFVDQACNFACASSSIGVDTLSIGVPPPPACNLPPFPSVGATENWTAEGGPWEICSDSTIAAGSTVILEAGSTLNVEAGSTLAVDGTFLVQGSASQPVTITGGTSLVTPPIRVAGLADLSFVDVQGRLYVAHGGSVLVADSTFTVNGSLSTKDSVGGAANGTYVQVERSTFLTGGLSVTDGTLVLRDSSFQGVGVSLLRGYFDIETTAIDGAGLSLTRERYTAPGVIDGVTITNGPGAALSLYGWNFLLGPNNVLQGNLYPVDLIGGLYPGTVVPSSGNTNNVVDANDGGIVGQVLWPQLDVPYVVDGSAQVGGGTLDLLPGARVRYTPGSGTIFFSTGGFRARGTAADPVRFEGFGGGSWSTLKFVANRLAPRFDHCVVDGADFGINADDTIVNVTSSTLRNNGTGAIGTTFGTLRARGVRFEDNLVGADETPLGNLDIAGTTGANVFVGNTVAVDGSDGVVEASDNYWGDPSGPQAPANPGGSGDPVAGAVTVLPFDTAPPTSGLPTVLLDPVVSSLIAGDSLLLRWQASDDGAIVSQRILFSEHSNSGYVELTSLSGHERSAEVVIPTAFPSSDNGASYFRVEAMDEQGQVGFDERPASIPFTDDLPPATFAFTSDLSGPFVFGDQVQVDWAQTGLSGTFQVSVVADGERGAVGFGGGTTAIDSWTVRMPYVSTDSARLAVSFLLGAGGRSRTFYSDTFTIRPDVRTGDVAPSVSLTSPSTGQTLVGGTVARIRWTAADDDSLRGFHLHVSTDSGRSWQTVATDLPGSARSYDWQIASSAGVADLMLRIVAFDSAFQNSSDSEQVALAAGTHALSSSTPFISLSGGGSHDLAIDAGPAFGSQVYWVFGSASGSTPGIDLGGGVILPLGVDAYFSLTLNRPFASVFSGFLGQLSSQGTASAALSLPPGTDPSLAGLRLSHAVAIAAVLGQVSYASNAVEVALLP